MTTEPEGLPRLDQDAGLVRETRVFGDLGLVQTVRTAGEALTAAPVAFVADAPDALIAAPDGRPIAVYFSSGVRKQLADERWAA